MAKKFTGLTRVMLGSHGLKQRNKCVARGTRYRETLEYTKGVWRREKGEGAVGLQRLTVQSIGDSGTAAPPPQGIYPMQTPSCIKGRSVGVRLNTAQPVG